MSDVDRGPPAGDSVSDSVERGLLTNAAALFASVRDGGAAFDTGFEAAVLAWLREYEVVAEGWASE